LAERTHHLSYENGNLTAMTRNEEIIGKVNGFLVEEFEVDASKITPEANLKEVLELDSLDYIDLVVVIESNFSFKVKPEDFTNISTFQDFYNYIISRVNTKAIA
jgi:acyl carrier protein